MLPSELLAVLATECDAALLLDRRTPGGGRLQLEGLRIVGHALLRQAGLEAKAYLLKPTVAGGLPAAVKNDAVLTHERVMDRFFIPVDRNPLLTKAMFDLISGLYDDLTDQSINLRTATHLLSAVLSELHPRPRILDFGCGTGVATEALSNMSRPGVALVGTDISERMLDRAVARGEKVISLHEFRASQRTWDGAIASFVLHYGVDSRDLARIAKQLSAGAKFAANYFRAGEDQISSLVALLEAHGLRLIERTCILNSTQAPNPMLVFRKTEF